MSTILEFTGSPEGLERIRKMVESGELTHLAGHKILGFGVAESRPDVVAEVDDEGRVTAAEMTEKS